MYPERVVADGVIADGVIALDYPVTKALVGLAYTWRLRTLRVEGGAMGTAHGKLKRIARLTVRVLNGMGGKAGTDEALMEDLIRRAAAAERGLRCVSGERL